MTAEPLWNHEIKNMIYNVIDIRICANYFGVHLFVCI